MGMGIDVDHPKASSDVSLHIRITGCQPSQSVEVRLEGQDQAGADFRSWATFIADAEGTVDLTTQAPQSGTYSGVDPMGLFWSMNPTRRKTSRFTGNDIPSISFVLSATAGEEQPVACAIERYFWDPETGVRRQPVQDDGLVGTFFCPSSGGPHAAVIVLGGSDGGLHEASAALLANHGLATLALAYFGTTPLPAALVEVPLEYCSRAIDWLAGQQAVDENRIGLMGWSKGGELALLAAATFPESIRAVAALSPSSVVWQGISGGGRLPKKACWSRDGQSLPYVPMRVGFLTLLKMIFGFKYSLLSSYGNSLTNTTAVEAARIPVENIAAPILLVSGSDDALWPAPQMCEQIVANLEQRGHPYSREHVCYQRAGHAFRTPYLPSNKEQRRDRMLFGGRPDDNARACAESWEKVIEFFSQHLLLH